MPQVRSPEVAFVFLVSGVCFSGGGNVCVYGLCMGFGVHTALFGLIQSGSVTEAGVQTVLEDWSKRSP